MAFLCPSRLGKVKTKRGYYNPVMGRITGSDSIETLVKLELGKQNANNPETRRIILQSFTGCAPEEISVKQGQKVHILFREGDWAYVLTHDKKQGYVPFTFCARIGKAPSYRAPKLNKDTEMLLENDEIGVNDDDDEAMEEIDTTLAEPPDGSYYNEFVSDSFVSEEWTEQDTQTDNEANETLEPEHENNPGNQYSESVTIMLDDDETNEHPEPDFKESIHTNSENLGQSVVINGKTDKRQDTLSRHGEIVTETAFKTSEKRPEIASAQNKQARTAFNTKVPLGRYLVLYDFEGHYEDDARVRQADIVTVLNVDDSDWYWVRKTDSTEGFVPSNFLFRLGLLASDSKEPVPSINENNVTKDISTTNALPASNSAIISKSTNSPAKNGAQAEHCVQTSFDNHKQYIAAEKSRTVVKDGRSAPVQSNQTPVFNQDNVPSPTVGSLSPRYCNFSFETNHSSHINSSGRGIVGYSENHLNTNVGDLQDAEELYPPPLEFSNSTEDSFEVYQETYKPDTVGINNENHRTSKYGNPFHMRNNSQPVTSLNNDSTLRLDLQGSASPGKLYTKHQNAQVRYRTDSNGKRVSKNKARPKSTPPGDLVLQTSQYYTNSNQNQHYESQQSAKLSGHQSERLTPRTNCNYSPTYHSSVWKPFQQQRNSIPVTNNVTQYEFAKGHSAFENPRSNRYSMYAYTNLETYVDASVSKSGSPNVSKQEGLYYPSGVHNIRSTKDNVSPPNTVQNAIRKLSDEENQNLFRKLDSIQNSFDGDDPVLQDTKSNKNGSQPNNANHNSENGFTQRARNQRNENDKQNISSTSPNQSNSFDKPSFSHKTRKSYKIATQGAERENKTSHIKHIVHSYSPVEGRSTEELNNSRNKSNVSNSVKIHNTDNQLKSQSTGHHYTQNIKLNNSNTLSTGKPQVKLSDQKEPNSIQTYQTKMHDINAKIKQNPNHYRENGTTQITELISQFDYNATSKADLPLEKGEVVQVSLEEQDSRHWYWAYSPKLRRHGYVPRNYVQAPQITMI